MKTIQSFCINHDTLMPGLYTSRVDGDVITYDLRFVRPNMPPFLEVAGMHTVEHLFATYVRNSAFEKQIVYFGPMGCRTGFYFLVREMSEQQVIDLVKETLAFIAEYEGKIPGATRPECGNYLEHDLPKAKEYAEKQLAAMAEWKPEKLVYPD